jgi:hypothetical protein
MIHAEIGAVYDDAERNAAKPPSIRELLQPVSRRLKDKGFHAGQREIRKIGQKPEFAARRWPRGLTIATELKQR